MALPRYIPNDSVEDYRQWEGNANRALRWEFLLALLLLLFQAAVAQQELSPSLEAALKSDGPVTLFSIFPKPDPEGEQFLGYRVLGQAVLPIEQEATRAVLRGLQSADPSSRQSCFAPRHALLVEGHRVLICYACHSVTTESPEGQREHFAITEDGHKELATAVKAHGLQWQGWQPVGNAFRHQSGLAITIPEGFEARGTAGTEILYLESRRQAVQTTRLPGALVLESEESTEVLETSWLDHSDTGRLIWYLTGLPTTFESTRNRRICRGSAYELAQLKAQLDSIDQPTKLGARIQLLPLADQTSLERELTRFRRAGYRLETGRLNFKVGRAVKDGIEMEVSTGLVNTAHGPVLVTAELPSFGEESLDQIVRNLQAP